MRLTSTLFVGLLTATEAISAAVMPAVEQIPLEVPETLEDGVGHFSEWSRETKREFLVDWQASKESEWIIVLGNEGGDLDSITAALSWAYHLEHATANTSEPLKAIALLQTPTDQLDLRPENKLALANSKMSSGHRDLLNINELPEDPETLSPKIKGLVLVDHGVPLRKWQDAKILSIFDHHVDVGAGPDADPRVIEKVASCTTLVARQMLKERAELPEEYHLPHELLELVLSAIAIDSDALNPKKSTNEDYRISEKVLALSQWSDKDLEEVMDDLDGTIGDARKDLGDLSLRDLLRRDWKGDFVNTPSPRTPTVNLGFASIPISMDAQIERTEWKELFGWFATEAAWTAEQDTDISICLGKYKVKKNAHTTKKKKIREIVLVVRDDVRVDDEQADELFKVAYEAIENDKNLNVKPWHRANELGKRQMVWEHEYEDGGRKYVRPLVEEAVRNWK